MLCLHFWSARIEPFNLVFQNDNNDATFIWKLTIFPNTTIPYLHCLPQICSLASSAESWCSACSAITHFNHCLLNCIYRISYCKTSATLECQVILSNQFVLCALYSSSNTHAVWYCHFKLQIGSLGWLFPFEAWC